MSAGVTTLPFDFDIFLRSGSTMKPEMRGVRPRRDAVLELRAQQGREQPGADDVLALRAQVEREDGVEQLVVAHPAARELRGERGGHPGVHDVVLADEAARLAALRLVEAGGGVRRRVDRELVVASGRIGWSKRGLPSASSGYQTGIGTPKNRWREISQSPVRPPTQFS